MGAEMAAVPQAISSGDNPQRWNHWNPHTAQGRKDQIRCAGLFVQQIGTTRGVTDTQWQGRGRSCHRQVKAGEEPGLFPQVWRPSLLVVGQWSGGWSGQPVVFQPLNTPLPCLVSVTKCQRLVFKCLLKELRDILQSLLLVQLTMTT